MNHTSFFDTVLFVATTPPDIIGRYRTLMKAGLFDVSSIPDGVAWFLTVYFLCYFLFLSCLRILFFRIFLRLFLAFLFFFIVSIEELSIRL